MTSNPPRRTLTRARIESADNATPKGPMTLTGIVRTTRGYAVAIATLDAEGNVQTVKLGHSQTERQFVAQEHARGLSTLANRA